MHAHGKVPEGIMVEARVWSKVGASTSSSRLEGSREVCDLCKGGREERGRGWEEQVRDKGDRDEDE